MTLPLFALTTRGIEAVATQEMAALPGWEVSGQAYRRVLARADESNLAAGLALRTVDDLYVQLAAWSGVGHTRAMLVELEDRAAALPTEQAVEAINTLRPTRAQPSFSVTASFVGKRNYNTDEIKEAIAAGVEGRHPWQYTPDDREADLNLRVFIEHTTALVGLRLASQPLHERAWKVSERPGALKPTVAAALCRLVGLKAEARMIDPCCGGGTLLIEAALSGAVVRGGDLEAEAVAAAQANGVAAGLKLQAEQWDARRLPLPDGDADCVLSNLPWGRQIAVDAALETLYAGLCREIERCLKPGGRAGLLTSQPGLLRFERLQPTHAIEISLYGQTPTISLWDSPTNDG
jgi:23S rRNA G2445 N2-methylase RlmL